MEDNENYQPNMQEDAAASNKRIFLSICHREIQREGLERLLTWLENDTDFFTAPASSKHHGDYEGGLVEHHLNVHLALKSMLEKFNWIEIPAETVAVVTLFHDVCKHNCYPVEMKNKKIYDEDVVANADPRSVKKDSGGYFIWDQVPSYTFDDPFPIGHGEKSVIEIMKHMPLTDQEIGAIRWHMGAFDSAFRGGDRGLNGIYDNSNLAVLLHLADMTATYLLEGKNG